MRLFQGIKPNSALVTAALGASRSLRGRRLQRHLGDVALEIVALAGVPPFGELDDDDLHERDGEEDDPSGACQ